MVVACEQVWREVSNYLEGDIAPELRAAVDDHSRTCPRCRAVLQGARNVVQLFGDERMVEVPLGFSHRLHRKLEENMPGRRGRAWGWLIGLAAAAGLTRLMSAMQVSVWPVDPSTFAAVIIVFFLIAALACWIPASRAAALDPMAALRED